MQENYTIIEYEALVLPNLIVYPVDPVYLSVSEPIQSPARRRVRRHRGTNEVRVVFQNGIETTYVTNQFNNVSARFERQVVNTSYKNCMQIGRLRDDRYKVIKPISIVVSKEDEDYVAAFETANIAMSGETASEAIQHLRDYIAEVFDLLCSSPKLGPAMIRQLNVLEEHIVEEGRR